MKVILQAKPFKFRFSGLFFIMSCHYENVHYGHRELSSLTIQVGEDTTLYSFRVHREILTCAFEGFDAHIKDNVAYFSKDDPEAWRVILSMCYPPATALTIPTALALLPIANSLKSAWLREQVQSFFCALPENERKPAYIDAVGGKVIVNAWFISGANSESPDSEWSIRAIPRFVKVLKCEEARLVLFKKMCAAFLKQVVNVSRGQAHYWAKALEDLNRVDSL
jgi:hypothetical protein